MISQLLSQTKTSTLTYISPPAILHIPSFNKLQITEANFEESANILTNPNMAARKN
jgi:hypothetical protein